MAQMDACLSKNLPESSTKNARYEEAGDARQVAHGVHHKERQQLIRCLHLL